MVVVAAAVAAARTPVSMVTSNWGEDLGNCRGIKQQQQLSRGCILQQDRIGARCCRSVGSDAWRGLAVCAGALLDVFVFGYIVLQVRGQGSTAVGLAVYHTQQQQQQLLKRQLTSCLVAVAMIIAVLAHSLDMLPMHPTDGALHGPMMTKEEGKS